MPNETFSCSWDYSFSNTFNWPFHPAIMRQTFFSGYFPSNFKLAHKDWNPTLWENCSRYLSPLKDSGYKIVKGLAKYLYFPLQHRCTEEELKIIEFTSLSPFGVKCLAPFPSPHRIWLMMTFSKENLLQHLNKAPPYCWRHMICSTLQKAPMEDEQKTRWKVLH